MICFALALNHRSPRGGAQNRQGSGLSALHGPAKHRWGPGPNQEAATAMQLVSCCKTNVCPMPQTIPLTPIVTSTWQLGRWWWALRCPHGNWSAAWFWPCRWGIPDCRACQPKTWGWMHEGYGDFKKTARCCWVGSRRIPFPSSSA